MRVRRRGRNQGRRRKSSWRGPIDSETMLQIIWNENFNINVLEVEISINSRDEIRGRRILKNGTAVVVASVVEDAFGPCLITVGGMLVTSSKYVMACFVLFARVCQRL